jgi:hypothetical protein
MGANQSAGKGRRSVIKWGQIGAPEKEEIGRKMGANRSAGKGGDRPEMGKEIF